EEKTGDLYQEKTMREELTVRERKDRRDSYEEEGQDIAEDTMIVDPQELDFHSIFEEIDVEELSDITRAIGISDASLTGATAPMTFSDNSSREGEEKEEITGDLIEENPPVFSLAPSPTPSLSPETTPPAKVVRQGREFLWLPILILVFLLSFSFYHFFLSSAPGDLKLQFQPADAKVFLDGKPVAGSPPVFLPKLPSHVRYELKIERPGFETYQASTYLFPNRTRSIKVNLNKSAVLPLKVTSEPEGATIFFNGQSSGMKTPAELDSKAFSYPVVLGLSLGDVPTWEKRLEAPPQSPMEVFADLKVQMGTLAVTSSPSGALVKVGDKTLGKTPLGSFPMPANETFTLRIELNGFKPYENDVSLAPGQKLEIYHPLEKIPSR
ncbi:MAG: PEGA domain-containing protein, partial [Deltaproteobacteria bacterium]|nr:PEGA domain-containing protein [Deltaproteobacteria bacterium]